MIKRRLLSAALCAVLLIAIAAPVQAQDGGDDAEAATEEFIALILEANDNLYAAEYFSYEATQSQQQLISSGVGLRRSELSRQSVFTVDAASVQVNGDGVPVAFEAELTQSDTRRVNDVIRTDANLVMGYEMRLVDASDLFVRINNVSGVINENAISEITDSADDTTSANFITGWVNLSQNPEQLTADLAYLNAQSNEINFLEALNLNAMLNLQSGVTWTPEMVEQIRERGSDVENQRIFEVTLDPVSYLNSLGLIDLVESDTLAGDTELMLQELFEGTTLTQRITLTIDEEAGPNFAVVETAMAVVVNFSDGTGAEENAPDATGGVSLNLDMETVTTVSYDDIGSAFEVTAPSPELAVDVTCDQETLDVVFTITNTGANMPEAVPFSVSREGEVPDDNELQLEAGSRTIIERQNGEFTLEIPAYEVSEAVECVELPEEESAE